MIINFGSMNVDHVYEVAHVTSAKETQKTRAYSIGAGGKGLNQSIALAHAGAHVAHAACVSSEDTLLPETLRGAGVDVRLLKTVALSPGHAVIQVDLTGQNAIFIHGGANDAMDRAYVEKVLDETNAEAVLLQNETTATRDVIELAHEKGMKIFMNAAPADERLDDLPIEHVDLLIVNEIEGAYLASAPADEPASILKGLRERFPTTDVLLTLGADGAMYDDGKTRIMRPAYTVDTVDTTGAGDTFVGYVIAALLEGMEIVDAMDLATAASALAVTKKGAAASIPTRAEVEAWRKERT